MLVCNYSVSPGVTFSLLAFFIITFSAIRLCEAQAQPQAPAPDPDTGCDVGIVYHEHETDIPEDRCGFMDPYFPYDPSQLDLKLRIVTIIHGALMIWVFVFFVPVSAFPVLWHRICPDYPNPETQEHKKWMWDHIFYSRFVFPLLTAATGCAMYVKHTAHHVFQPKGSACSYFAQFHSLLGCFCYVIYAYLFFMGFFCGKALHNDRYRSLRVWHGVGHALAYSFSVPLLAMARVSKEQGAKRYLYILPYFIFVVTQVNIFVRMKIADHGALNWHIHTEEAIANENKGVVWRLSQWPWNFGQPKRRDDNHLFDLKPQRSESLIKITKFVETYKAYWIVTRLACGLMAILMTLHLGLLYSTIQISSNTYFPSWRTAGDFYTDWALLKTFAL